ncbi:MAG: hypothetical protein DMG40_27065 [Acidobacteria bacterium]|nr:MAG: hypothetical protein DMG40_27065 [Acidobacteriota bacterium]
MSYDPRLLFAQISIRLDQTPARSLLELSREFQVGADAIQNVVASMTGGVKFTNFKDDLLLAKLTRLFLAKPTSPINELWFELGYKSSRAFARAVRRACGLSPADLRKRVISDVSAQKTPPLKASSMIH